MSQENVEIVRRMYEAFYRGDADSALAYFDLRVEFDASSRVGGTVYGREKLNARIGAYLGAWDDWSEEIEEICDLGSQVIVVATQRGRGKKSGADVENRYAVLYELKGALITRMMFYADRAAALEAAGYSP